MARIQGLNPAELADDLQPLFRKFTSDYGDFTNQAKMFALAPEAFRHLYGLLASWCESINLPARLVEIAVLTTSRINRCSYCIGHHGTALVALGLSPETVERILEPEPPGLTAVERLVRDYARLVSERPWGIRDHVFEDLRSHFSEAQIVQLTIRIALCGLFNRVNDALQIETEDAVLAAMLAHKVEVPNWSDDEDEVPEAERHGHGRL